MPSPAWVTPTHATASTLATSAAFNTHENDLLYMKDRMDNPPRCWISNSATQSIPNATPTAVAFNTEFADTAALHDNATNNSRITIPTGEDGWYLFTGFVEFAANATGQRTLYLRRAGTDILSEATVDAAAGANATRLAVAFVLPANAATYYELVVVQNSTAALNISATNYFSAQRTA